MLNLSNNYLANRSTGAVVLVSGREVASRVVQSIVQTMAKTMDALLFRQQLQVKKCPLCLARKDRVLYQGRKKGGAMGVSAPPRVPQGLRGRVKGLSECRRSAFQQLDFSKFRREIYPRIPPRRSSKQNPAYGTLYAIQSRTSGRSKSLYF